MASYSGVSGVLTPTFTTYSGIIPSGIAPSGFSPFFIFPISGDISVISGATFNFPVYGTGVAGGGGSGVVYPTIGQLYPYY